MLAIACYPTEEAERTMILHVETEVNRSNEGIFSHGLSPWEADRCELVKRLRSDDRTLEHQYFG